MSYTDSIESHLRALSEAPLPPESRLAGKDMGSGRAGAWVALDSHDSVHLLLNLGDEPRESFRRLSKFRQRFLTFEVKEWVVSGQPKKSYLDICCIADRKSEYRRPFVYFASDCLAELDAAKSGTASTVYGVAQRWHRFWIPSQDEEVTAEWVKGLLGELWLLRDLIRDFGERATKTWTGPLGKDQDFQANGMALEVKTTETMPPVLTISNLDQLDYTLFKALWVVVQPVTERIDGVALPDVVGEIENSLKDPAVQELFWKVLAESGYRRHFEARYKEFLYKRNKTQFFSVKGSFPALTRKSLRKALDQRVSNIRYSVKLAGISPKDSKDAEVRKALEILCCG